MVHKCGHLLAPPAHAESPQLLGTIRSCAGTFVPYTEGMRTRTCDARCHEARGQTCRCWCGGRYHGRGARGIADLAADFALELDLATRPAVRDPGPARCEQAWSAKGGARPRRARARVRTTPEGVLALPFPPPPKRIPMPSPPPTPPRREVFPKCPHCGDADVRRRTGFRRSRSARDRAPKWVCGKCYHSWLVTLPGTTTETPGGA
jgi:hypothetical protein